MLKRVAIVTGAGSGIGKAIALSFAEKRLITIIADMNVKAGKEVVREIQEKYDIDSSFVKTDVINVSSLKNMVEVGISKYKTIDILVNNAGILHTTPMAEITEEEWDKILNVNLRSVFFASQYVLPYMIQKKEGRIINISSMAGRMGGYKNGLAYTASKAGVIGLTMGMARRLAEHNITVNAVAPGTTLTNIVKQFSGKVIKHLHDLVPLGRLAKPEDVAAVVTFLASREAEFITGVTIDVNGGMFIG